MKVTGSGLPEGDFVENQEVEKTAQQEELRNTKRSADENEEIEKNSIETVDGKADEPVASKVETDKADTSEVETCESETSEAETDKVETCEPETDKAETSKAEENKVQEQSSARHKKRKWLLIPVAIVFVFLLTYAGFAYYFSSHYYFGTTIAGRDCSCMTVQDAEEMFQDEVREYRLTVNARGDVQETICAGEISIDYPIQEELQEICKEQNPFLWFQGVITESSYNISEEVTYDTAELLEKITTLSIFDEENQREPVSAVISEYLPDIKGYRILLEDEGCQLSPEAADQILEAFLQMQESMDLEEKELYLAPSVCSDNVKLVRLVEQLNHYTQTQITYQFGEEEVILDGDTIHEWLSIRGSSVYLDKKAVRAYVENMAEERDTYYTEKEFVTTGGTTKKLRSAFGWMLDVDAETEQLLADLQSGESVVREPEYKRRGADFSENNIGDSYVEIDLGHQHLYLYIEGELILEADVVSGCMANGNATPAGVYDLEYRTKNVILRGPTWESHVNYWMPFNGSVGMHDATWRSEFGADIYMEHGSHGCVNLPYGMAQKIYGYVYSGMPIICYY